MDVVGDNDTVAAKTTNACEATSFDIGCAAVRWLLVLRVHIAILVEVHVRHREPSAALWGVVARLGRGAVPAVLAGWWRRADADAHDRHS